MKSLITTVLCLAALGPALTGCTSAGTTPASTLALPTQQQVQPFVNAAIQGASLYFQAEQLKVNAMPAGPAKDQAQAKLLSNETTETLVGGIGQIVVGTLPSAVPATQPSK